MKLFFYCLFLACFFASFDVWAVTSNADDVRGKIKLFPIDRQHLVVAGHFISFYQAKIQAQYGEKLRIADLQYKDKKIKYWQHNFAYNYAFFKMQEPYTLTFARLFENKNVFQLKQISDSSLFIQDHGNWINAVGLVRLESPLLEHAKMLPMADLVYFAYLRFNRPLQNGETLQVSTPETETVTFTYSDSTALTRAIKVNQEGYMPDAREKYAYLGMWLGTLGALPVDSHIGKPFYIRDAMTHENRFTGLLKKRSDEQTTKENATVTNLYGETILEMDFSDFKQEGDFYIYLPHVGRSFTFKVASQAIEHAYFVQMRGLFHQRSGLAKDSPFTYWTMSADHLQTYRARFAPNDAHYKSGSGCFKKANGQPVEVKHFDMIAATATNEVIENLNGGWWDAGDYDRRTYHFAIVDQLLSTYLLFPENFSDCQLNIPESGNAIPDMIDEAAWGVDVWRRAQNEKGGVGCWIEANSHPSTEYADPAKDPQRYYLALPTRESTLEYAIYAAKLARAYRQAKAVEYSNLFAQSAIRAWNYALNEKNRCCDSFIHPTHGLVFYTEPEKLSEAHLFKAAQNLSMLTGDARYDLYLKPPYSTAALKYANEKTQPYFLSELIEKPSFEQVAVAYRKQIIERANSFLKSQSDLAYRNINYPRNHPFFMTLAWGNAMPARYGAYFSLAWSITGQQKYRTAALLLVDWLMGANPQGRSMVTGLGKVYPVRFLSHPQWFMEKRFADPIPGIMPYMYTGRNAYGAFEMLYGIDAKPRLDQFFMGYKQVLIPKSIYPFDYYDLKKLRYAVDQNLPVYRRFANIESFAVDQNEFTVWETLSPAAALFGTFLPSRAFVPQKKWLEQKPVQHLNALEGYITLP